MPRAIPEMLDALDVEYTIVTNASTGAVFGQKLPAEEFAKPGAEAGVAWLERQSAAGRVLLFKEFFGAVTSDPGQLTNEIRTRIRQSASPGGNWRQAATSIDGPVLDMVLRLIPAIS